jgi:hypothetical protein
MESEGADDFGGLPAGFVVNRSLEQSAGGHDVERLNEGIPAAIL